MKIGIIGTRGIPNQYGGFEQFAGHLSVGLVEKGHEVIVYNSSLHPYKETEWNNVQIVHCKDWENSLGTVGQFFYDLNCIQDARRRNFDILLHLGYTSDSIWHRRWPRSAVNIVNMDGMEWKRSKYNQITRHFLKRAEGLAARNADTLIADSIGIQDYLKSEYNKPSSYIPYGATIFSTPNPASLQLLNLDPFQYSLLIARMEPENNIEPIINAYQESGLAEPLIIVGGITNSFGRFLSGKYSKENTRFVGAIYDQELLNNLRYHSKRYFHGHSVGGTNPSLLEAMACGCNIIAHDNIFNRAVLEKNAFFFSDQIQLASILKNGQDLQLIGERRECNLQKIKNHYSWDKIIGDYEAVMVAVVAGR
jgi:glycosyltransferase involved in cell wall biosynthesis